MVSRYAVILPDGAHDLPLPELDGRTPLEAAATPWMDRIAREGRIGRALTIPPGFTPATDVGTLMLLGYDPHRYYSGRAPLEAAARGLQTRPDQLIFRSNFVHIQDDRMADFTAGHIEQADADRLIAALNQALGPAGCEFHAGVSYRNLLLLAEAATLELTCAPPHDIPDQPIADHQPRGHGAERIHRLAALAHEVLADHPVNRERRARGARPATDIWLWGQGRPVRFEPFAERYGLSASVITAVDIIRGMAVATGMQLIQVPGATGYIDTDYQAKGQAAVRALQDAEVVFVHVEAPDEAGHQGNAAEKVRALERIDEAIVGPVLTELQRWPSWRILVAADHPTPVSTRAHSAIPPLFAFAGSDVPPADPRARAFTEVEALQGLWLDPGHQLMPLFLNQSQGGAP